jgi:hypothetical protein
MDPARMPSNSLPVTDFLKQEIPLGLHTKPKRHVTRSIEAPQRLTFFTSLRSDVVSRSIE